MSALASTLLGLMLAVTIELSTEALVLGGSAAASAIGSLLSGFAAIVTSFKEGIVEAKAGP